MGVHSTRTTKADLYAARVERAKANSLPSVRAAKIALAKVQEDIPKARSEIRLIGEIGHKVAQLAQKNYRGSRHKKAISKAVRSRVIHARADTVRADLAKLLENELELKEQLEVVRVSVGLPQIDDRYYSLRHQVMVELYESELGDMAALERKQTYMELAGIPAGVSPDKVLYYERGGDIHLFYGGRRPYNGEANFADGIGHGHVVLVPRVNGSYVVRFTRLPGK